MAQTRSSGGLFDPARIGSVDLRNRVILPAMTTRLADAEGFVTDDSIAYYAARARGVVGLVTVEMAAVERAGRHRKHELGVFHDRYLPGLTRLAAAVHGLGAKASIQLGHAGGHTRVDISGETPIAPSPVAHSAHEGTTEIVIPQEMSIARIHDVRDAYVAAAARAAAAGFDAVEIHAAHGYLLSQFLCPVENLRRDDYGGTVENRSRLISEIVALIKETVPGLAVIVRISGDELFPEGMPLKDACEVAQPAERAGADAIHVSAGHYRSLPSAAIMTPPMAMPERIFLDLAATIRKAVDVPVIAVGRLGHGKDAEMAIVSGKADFVALGRPLLADPDWVVKSMRGEIPRQCLACNTCVDEMRKGDTLHCLVNPITGREREFAGRECEPIGRKIAVVGAGPAGLSYASLAAAGNAVTVFEKSRRCGGALLLAGQAPVFQGVVANAASLERYVDALQASCRSAGGRRTPAGRALWLRSGGGRHGSALSIWHRAFSALADQERRGQMARLALAGRSSFRTRMAFPPGACHRQIACRVEARPRHEADRYRRRRGSRRLCRCDKKRVSCRTFSIGRRCVQRLMQPAYAPRENAGY